MEKGERERGRERERERERELEEQVRKIEKRESERKATTSWTERGASVFGHRQLLKPRL